MALVHFELLEHCMHAVMRRQGVWSVRHNQKHLLDAWVNLVALLPKVNMKVLGH